MAGGRRIWMPKKVGELVTIPFDFIGDLAPSETVLTAAVTATVYTGVDATPSAIISGSASISGSTVNQAITGGTVGVIYALVCSITTSLSQTLKMSAYCAIETDVP